MKELVIRRSSDGKYWTGRRIRTWSPDEGKVVKFSSYARAEMIGRRLRRRAVCYRVEEAEQ